MIVERKPLPFPARLVVVGGQASKVGKTSLVVDIIKAFPEQEWAAVKISPLRNELMPAEDHSGIEAESEGPFVIQIENDRAGSTDTSRFLAAGARKSVWVRASEDGLPSGLPALANVLRDAGYVIVESTRIAKFWVPDIFIMVLDPRKMDIKGSAQDLAALADVFVFRSRPPERGPSEFLVTQSAVCSFFQPMGKNLPEELQKIISSKIEV